MEKKPIRFCPELFAAWRLVDEKLKVPKQNAELNCSLLALEWVNARIAKGVSQVLLPPTVQEELANAHQKTLVKENWKKKVWT